MSNFNNYNLEHGFNIIQISESTLKMHSVERDYTMKWKEINYK